MRRPTTTLILSLAFVFLATSSSPAFVFRLIQLRWENRKEEIRSELMDDLSRKMDSDIAQQVTAVDKRLKAAASAHIDEEGKRLESLIRSEVTKMHRQAEALVAAEAKRLNEQTIARIEKLRAEASAKIAGETKTLQDLVRKEAAGIRGDVDQKMKGIDKKVNGTLEQFVAGAKRLQQAVENDLKTAKGDMRTTIESQLAQLSKDQFDKLSKQVAAQIAGESRSAKAELTLQVKAAVRDEVKSAQQNTPSKPKKKETPKPNDKKATVTKPVKPQKESEQEKE